MTPDLIAALETVVGSKRVWPLRADEGAKKPFITFQRAGGVPSNSFCGNTDKENGRWQINVWADTMAQADQIMRQAREVICDQSPGALRGVVLNEMQWREGYDTRTFGTQQDFSLWGPTPAT